MPAPPARTDAIFDRFELLVEQPRIGRNRPEFDEGVRSFVAKLIERECFMVRRILGVLVFFIAASAGTQGTTQTVVLTLSSERGYPQGFCLLEVAAGLNGGQARLFCGPGVGGASGAFAEDVRNC
jgi:hypothetical protein